MATTDPKLIEWLAYKEDKSVDQFLDDLWASLLERLPAGPNEIHISQAWYNVNVPTNIKTWVEAVKQIMVKDGKWEAWDIVIANMTTPIKSEKERKKWVHRFMRYEYLYGEYKNDK